MENVCCHKAIIDKCKLLITLVIISVQIMRNIKMYSYNANDVNY